MRIRRSKLIAFIALLAFLLILTFAAAVRVYNIALNPPGFFADEAAIGYNAYTLAASGADEYGVRFPFFFRSFGDYRNPLPVYLNIPAVALLGLNEFAVRLTAALAGILTVCFIFFIAREGSPWPESSWKNGFALASALFLAITPWHIHFSRFGSEYIYFPFLLSAGWMVFLLSQKILWLLPVSFLVLGATLYTYYPTWLVTPIFVVLILILYRKFLVRHWRKSTLSLLLFLLCTVPLVIGIRSGQALTRWNNVTVGKHAPASVLPALAKNYVSHFSPSFLFSLGDIDYPGHFIRRFSNRGTGELPVIFAPLILLGIVAALSKRTPFTLSLLALLVLYPLGSTIADTDGGAPLAFRSVIGVLPFPLFASYGAVALVRALRRKIFRLLVVGIVAVFAVFQTHAYLAEYHTEYPLYSSDFWGWQFGPRDIMAYFLAHKDSYDEMYIMGNFNAPEIFVKFYDPDGLCRQKCRIGDTKRLNPAHRQLFAVGTDRLSEIPEQLFLVKKTVFYPNGSPAFLVGSFHE